MILFTFVFACELWKVLLFFLFDLYMEFKVYNSVFVQC